MLDRIRASIPALPPAEQRVAKLLLADPRSFATLPVGELAERSHVSKPTVVRFCRSVGYDGLADFKLKLAGSVNEGVPFVHRSVDDDDKAGDIVVKVIDNAVAAMLRYRNAAAASAVAELGTTVARPRPDAQQETTMPTRPREERRAWAALLSPMTRTLMRCTPLRCARWFPWGLPPSPRAPTTAGCASGRAQGSCR